MLTSTGAVQVRYMRDELIREFVTVVVCPGSSVNELVFALAVGEE
jgi:2-succinyl-5-enolpyruvyl-6-hydroxy-3-cyclohexene-1-carboxylate synthase